MDQPFKRIHVPVSQELLDKAFSKASKIYIKNINVSKDVKKRILTEKKIRAASQVIRDKLDAIMKGIPQIDELDSFRRELVGILIDLDDFRKSLGAVGWCIKMMKTLEKEYLRRVRWQGEDFKSFVGRVSSVVNQISEELISLKDHIYNLRNLPSVRNDLPTWVVAGYPNVGKTTLLQRLTGSKPEIAPYPFTTKGIMVGYIGDEFERIQVIDTPGLLDRPLSSRNKIELQAILVLRELADLVIFLIDPTELCGYKLEEQLRLFREVSENLGKPILLVINKAELISNEKINEIRKSESKSLLISAETGEGVQELLERAEKLLGNGVF